MARPPDPLVGDGVLLVDKPAGMSSHDVVAACRRICGTRKVGHAGTLDPMATGLLLIGVNRATRLLTFLVGCDKAYDATVRLGLNTATDDAEGAVTGAVSAGHLTDERIAAAVRVLTGDIEQVPSAVSAIKIDGVRAYTRARGGEEVVLAPRPVRVEQFRVLRRRDGATDGQVDDCGGQVAGCVGQVAGGRTGPRTSYVDLDVTVDVSSGTYVRALARDLGAALGVGGHLTALRRTRVGGFSVAASSSLAALEQARRSAAAGTSGLPILPPEEVTRAVMPGRQFDAESARRLTHGVRPDVAGATRGIMAAYDPSGRLVAVFDQSSEEVTLKAVFANDW